jgi:hypothetical protein
VVSPKASKKKFVIPNHRYLFKQSIDRYPEQYWVEIFSYRFGQLLNLPVPPAHVAYNSDEGSCGALIEWFLRSPQDNNNFLFRFFRQLGLGQSIERYTAGGEFLQRLIPGYDRGQGWQHNFEVIDKLCYRIFRSSPKPSSWIKYWVETLIFDSLIGNTDRHQDNWGFIWGFKPNGRRNDDPRLTPIYDNGTSMGHEIIEKNFYKFEDQSHLKRYIHRGHHHMKWLLSDTCRIPHIEVISHISSKYPDSVPWIQSIIDFPMNEVEKILHELCSFNIEVPLSEQRAEFMFKLVRVRKELLMQELLKI